MTDLKQNVTQYLNIKKGITKVLISEILQMSGSLIAVIMLIVTGILTNNGNLPVPSEMIIWTVALSALIVIALIFYLIGVIQAKKEEHEFRLALIMTIASLALQMMAGVFEANSPVAADWLEFGCKICELIAFESVVSGIVNTAKKLQNEKVISIGKKMRIIVTVIWIAIIAAKIFEFISGDISETLHVIVELAETVDHIFYLILLARGIRMLTYETG